MGNQARHETVFPRAFIPRAEQHGQRSGPPGLTGSPTAHPEAAYLLSHTLALGNIPGRLPATVPLSSPRFASNCNLCPVAGRVMAGADRLRPRSRAGRRWDVKHQELEVLAVLVSALKASWGTPGWPVRVPYRGRDKESLGLADNELQMLEFIVPTPRFNLA